MKRTLNVFPATLVVSPNDLAQISSLSETLDTAVPMAKLTLNKLTPLGVEPKVFLYKLEAADARLWKQNITFDIGTNPLMTFDVVDFWRLSEFSAQRTLRTALISLVAKYPDLEKVTYDYLA